MNELGQTALMGKIPRKHIYVACPKCGKERWVRWSNYTRGGKTGLCLDCYNLSKHQEDNTNLLYYKCVKSVNHPRANVQGRVKRCVLVMESIIGRYLLPNEEVHHKNKNITDDNPDNLMLITHSEHVKLHHRLLGHNVK